MRYLIEYNGVLARRAKNNTWAKNRLAMQALVHFVSRRDVAILMEADAPLYLDDELKSQCRKNRTALSFLRTFPTPKPGDILLSADPQKLYEWKENGGIPMLFFSGFSSGPSSMQIPEQTSMHLLMLSRTPDASIELVTGIIRFPQTSFVIATGTKPAAAKRPPCVPPDVSEFFQEFKDRFVWDFLPFSFLYDLYVIWTTQKNLIPISSTAFGTAMRTLGHTDSDWDSANASRYLYLPAHLTKDEPLLADYHLTRWKNAGLRPRYGHGLTRRRPGGSSASNDRKES